jgi:ABC-type dipeptide/oligopeptide/nickel transport system permease component
MTEHPASQIQGQPGDPKDGQPEDDVPSIDIILDLTRERVAAQLTRITGMDTKAGLVLASASLLTGALATWHGPTNPGHYLPLIAEFMTQIPLISIVIYLVVIGTSFFALFPRGYYVSPDPSELWKGYGEKPERWTKRRVRAIMADDHQKNEQVVTQKIRWTIAAFIALAVEAFFVAVILFLQALG